MSFIAKNPLSIPNISSDPPIPTKGTRGIFAKDDGWYEIDDTGIVKKIANINDVKAYSDEKISEIIGSVESSDLDNAKTSGIYKVKKDGTYIGQLFVQNGMFVSQYYLKGIYDISSLSEANALGIPIRFRYNNGNEWTAWKTVASIAEEMDEETLNSAKAYTDSKDAENLSAAKTYADGKDAETLESAKSYTDEKNKAEMTSRVHFGDIGSLPGATGGISRIKFYANGYPTIESGSPLSVSIYNGSAFLASVSAPVGFGGDDYLDCDAKGNFAVSWMRGNVQMQMLEADDFISKMAEADSVIIYDSNAEMTYADVTYTATVSAKLDSEIERAKSAESEVLENAKSYADTKAAAAEENAKTYGKQTFAGALKGEKFDSIVRLDDVSALDRRLDTVVSSKNIIPFPYADGMSKTVKGVTFTVSDDGSITINGAATANAFFLLFEGPLSVKSGDTYTIKNIGNAAKYDESYWMSFNIMDSDGVYNASKTAESTDKTFTIAVGQKTIRHIGITVKSGYTANNIVIKPQIEEGTVSTAYTKHVSDLSGVSVKKYGKNFFDCYGISANSIENPGASCALSNTYGTTIDKTALSSASDVLTVTQSAHPNETQKFSYTNGFFCIGLSNLLEGQAYTLSFDFTATDDPFSMMSNFTGNSVYALLNGSTSAYWKKISRNRYSVSFTYTKRTDYPLRRYIEFRLYGMSGTFSAFQLEPLSTASAYVPWSAPETYTVGADGAVQNLSANEDVTTLATDNEGTVLKTKYNRDLNAAFNAETLESVKSYVDAKVAETLASAKNYTDTKAKGYAPLDANGKIPDSYLYGVTVKQYGVRWKGTSSTACERLGDAVGLTAKAHKGFTESVDNDFDNIYPWSDIKTCNIDADGNVLAYLGEPSFARDGTNGDVMVEIPKFYYKRVKTGIVEEIWICGTKLPGYELHPLFIDNGKEVSKVFHSVYNASSFTDETDNKVKLQSITGVQPRVRTTRANFRTYARNKGAIWGIEDISCVNALQLLYLVEYADTHSQSALGSGADSLSFSANIKALEETTNGNTITIASTYKDIYKLGQRIEIGEYLGTNNITTTPRTITAITTDEETGQTTITFDGDPITIAVGNMMWNVAPLNGSCDELNGKSGWLAGENNYTDHFADVNYRGIEGFHAKLFRFIDGVNIKDRVVYYANSIADYADGVYDGKYRAVGYSNAEANGFVSAFGYDEKSPWVMFTTETKGVSTIYVPDYYYQDTGERQLAFGGNLATGANSGVFFFACSYAFSYSSFLCGAHLLVKKP